MVEGGLLNEIEGIPLVKLNDFAKAYAGITFEKGKLKVAAEVKSKQGRFTGYVEPVFDHMAIFDPAEDNESPIGFIWRELSVAHYSQPSQRPFWNEGTPRRKLRRSIT